MTSRLLRGLAVGFVATAVLAGCSETKAGIPQLSGGEMPATVAPGSGTSTTGPSSTAAGSDIEPCELLSPADAANVGLGAGKPNTVGRLKTCSWTASGKFAIAVTVSNKGLGGLNGENVGTGKHKAVKTTETASQGCGVVMEISNTASVIVVASLAAGGNDEQACPKAIDIAKIIDPKLP